VTDFVYAFRESETPTIYCIWTALFLLASVIRREAWVSWFRKKRLFSSFYLFLVGPPSTKKSFLVDEAAELLDDVGEYGLVTKDSKYIKKMCIINQATPELIEHELSKLSLREIKQVDEDGRESSYYPGACSVLAASELSTFLGKQKYQEGKISLLLKLYDCKKKDRIGTMARGWKYIRNVHTMFIAATTKRGMSDSVPSASMGDGFLSRTILVNVDKTFRRRPLPKEVKGAPSRWDLIMRLGWVAEKTIGPHELTPEAHKHYNIWYNRFKDNMEVLGEDVSPVFSRIDLDVIKVALLFKAQRYSLGDKIEVEDVKEAIKVVEATVKTSPDVVIEVGGDEMRRIVLKVSNYIKKRGKVDRSTLMRNTGLVAGEMSQPLDWLLHAGKIGIWQDGKRTDKITRSIDEIYKWIAKDE